MAYTSHGHHIPNTQKDALPPIRARCGAISFCKVCKKEAEAAGVVFDDARN